VIDIILITLSLPVGITAALYGASVSRHRALQRDWREAARQLGLTQVREGRAYAFGALRGMAGDYGVRVDNYQRGKEHEYEAGTRVTIWGGSGLTLKPEELVGLERGFLREVELGDPGFDDAVWVLGPPDHVRAVLDSATRRELRALIGGAIPVAGRPRSLAGGFRVSEGVLDAHIAYATGIGSSALLAGVIQALLLFARKLEAPEDAAARIAENMASEPEWGVRLQNLRFLVENFPRHPRTREVAQRACEDEREEVQLAAALALGGEQGRRLLLEIASREWSDDASASRAVGALGETLPREPLLAILQHALRTRRTRTARACLESLGAYGGPAAVEPIARVLAVEAKELGSVAARALGTCRAEGAEEPLLQALHHAPPAVRQAAVEALGRAGTFRSVLPLKELAARKEVGEALRRAARQAVAEIQSRMPGASPGQVSLADGDSGALSIADQDPRGQVSYPK